MTILPFLLSILSFFFFNFNFFLLFLISIDLTLTLQGQPLHAPQVHQGGLHEVVPLC